MDSIGLRLMDQEADRAIARWTAASLAVNLLPPPFDSMANAAVLAKLGLRLADIYEVETTWETARSVAVAMLGGILAVPAAFLAVSSWAKWVPGLNFWVGLLLQPPLVAALGFAVGHGFKEYFRAERVGRRLTADELSDLAAEAFRERLEAAKATLGVAKQAAPRAALDVATLVALPYSKRQFIFLATDDSKPATMKRRGKEIICVSSDVAGQLTFPSGHPRDRLLYAGHPTAPTLYYPSAAFHRSVFEQKFWEAVRLLAALGARHIRVDYETGWSTELATTLRMPFQIPGLKGEFKAGTQSRSQTQVLFEASLPGNRMREVPDDLLWLRDDQWQTLIDLRQRGNMREFVLDLKYQDDFGVDAGVASIAGKAHVDIGGTFQEYRATVWRMVCNFG